jgi:hypothetical protein
MQERSETRTAAAATADAVARDMKTFAITAALGAASVVLYVILYLYATETEVFAARARAGEKWLAVVPIAVALVFSFVHGAFTGQFWDALGLKAKGRK